MSTTHVAVLLLSLLSFVTTFVGVALALWLRESARAVAGGIGFSAGIMILISLLELLPESRAEVGLGTTLAVALAGAALVGTVHLIVPHSHLIKEKGVSEQAVVRSAYLVVFGLILHDVPEGFAMATAYVASPDLGVLVAVGIALHNLPEEFAMAVPALAARRKGLLFGAAAFSALAEPVGAVVGLVVVGITPRFNAYLLAFAAGAMIFISVHEVVPMALRYRHVGFFLVGVVLSALVYGALAALTR